jgi:hypothetical protein
MCIPSEEASGSKPTDPDVSAPQRPPAHVPPIPIKEPVSPDRRQMERPRARPSA